MKRQTVLIVVVVMLLISGLMLLPAAQGEPTAQDDPTAQQQTVEALIQARFTQTAEAEQLLVLTQIAQTQAAQPEPPSPPTQTAAFEATVDAAFSQAVRATAQAEMTTAVTARGLEIITPQNLPRLEQLGNLNQSVRNATCAAFSPDGKTLAVGSVRGVVVLWDVAAGVEIRRFANQSDTITDVAFNPNGRLLAASSNDGTVHLWDAMSGADLLTLEDDVVYSLAFSPDGTTLATGSENGIVQTWDVTTGTQMQVITGQVGGVRGMAFHPDNRQIAIGGDADIVQVWDITAAAPVFDLPYSPVVTAVAYSPDGLWLMAASQNSPPWQWEAASGVPVWGKTVSAFYSDIAFSPDGLLLISANRNQESLVVWEAATGSKLATLNLKDPVVDVAFSPNGADIVTVSGNVRLWGVRAPEIVAPTPEPVLPTLTPKPGATPRPEIFPTDTLADVQIVEQVFEHGRMFWIRHNLQIWVMTENPDVPGGGDWFCYSDTFEEGDPETDPSLVPPDDLLQPKRGFGKVWRDQPAIRDALGWAVTPEFDLISYYTYIAGGYVQDGQYYPGPGEHRLTTLYGDSISFFERELRGDCVGGIWQPTGE